MTRTQLGSNPCENYQRFFVPQIGAPMAEELIPIAAPRAGERVLDVACGTGVVARMAAEAVGERGSVAGLDVTPAMLKVARESTPEELHIEWRAGSAGALPFGDAAFDVVFCQMGLQFFPSKLRALREIRRVLAPGGRAVLNLAGPTPPLFEVLVEALDRHFGAPAARFVDGVFSLYDPWEVRELMTGAGFTEVHVTRASRTLTLPPAREFLWEYLYSTPLAATLEQASEASLAALEDDVCAGWEAFADDGGVRLDIETTTCFAR